MTTYDPKSRERRRALKVACPHCGSRPGQRCIVRGPDTPLETLPAHHARMEAAPGDGLTRDELLAMIRPAEQETP